MPTRRAQPHLGVRDSFARLAEICRETEGWQLELALGAPRPDLSPAKGLAIHDLVVEVHMDGSPPPIAVIAPAEDSIDGAAAICLDEIRHR